MIYQNKEQLAQFAIEYFLKHRQIPKVNKEEVPICLHQKSACFVSIYIMEDLRGCIGDFLPFEPLYRNIIKNAVNAAFYDFRFLPVTSDDLPNLTIEVSILTPLVEYKLTDYQELLHFLEKNKPGLMIEKENKRAIFLPQVWEKLPNPTEFLSNLSLKAGLKKEDWQKPGIKFSTFSLKD